MSFPIKSADNVNVAKATAEVADRLRALFGDGAVLEVRDRKAGKDNIVVLHDIWAKVEKDRFLDFVDTLAEFDFPHFHIISGNDDGDVVTLYYHFSLFQVAGRCNRIAVAVAVPVDKKDLVMPSLFSRIPGVEYSERETREMFGVDFDGLPNKALVFLPENWDESIKPWRRDETGPSANDVRELS